MNTSVWICAIHSSTFPAEPNVKKFFVCSIRLKAIEIGLVKHLKVPHFTANMACIYRMTNDTLETAPCLAVMASRTKCLPVCFVPEQFRITSVRNHMVNNSSRSQFSFPQAFHAERVLSQILFPCCAPCAVVSPGAGVSASAVSCELLMLLTITALVAQVGTTRIAARASWLIRHIAALHS